MCLGLYIILVPRADKLEFVSQTAKGTKGRCSMISDHKQNKKSSHTLNTTVFNEFTNLN